MTRVKWGPEMHQKPPAENKNGHRMSLGFEKQAHIADAAKTYKGDTVGRMSFFTSPTFPSTSRHKLLVTEMVPGQPYQ